MLGKGVGIVILQNGKLFIEDENLNGYSLEWDKITAKISGFGVVIDAKIIVRFYEGMKHIKGDSFESFVESLFEKKD